MAMLGGIQTRGQITEIRQVMDYVYQLEEQVRYALKHLDGENIAAGAIGVEQLSSAAKAQMQGAGQNTQGAGMTAARLKTDSLRIDNAGIKQTAGAFKVTADAGSVMKLGGTEESPALMIEGTGGIAAQRVTLAGRRAPGMEILLEDGTGPETAYRIAVGPNKPSGHGIIWLKTGTEGNDGFPCDVFFIA